MEVARRVRSLRGSPAPSDAIATRGPQTVGFSLYGAGVRRLTAGQRVTSSEHLSAEEWIGVLNYLEQPRLHAAVFVGANTANLEQA